MHFFNFSWLHFTFLALQSCIFYIFVDCIWGFGNLWSNIFFIFIDCISQFLICSQIFFCFSWPHFTFLSFAVIYILIFTDLFCYFTICSQVRLLFDHFCRLNHHSLLTTNFKISKFSLFHFQHDSTHPHHFMQYQSDVSPLFSKRARRPPLHISPLFKSINYLSFLKNHFIIH